MIQSRQRQIYDSCRILSPDGELMCLVGEKKARWYLDRGLGRQIADDPLTIELTFAPKGLGHAGDPFYTRPRANVCAGCGDTDNLTLHHILPRGYRRYFPEEIKSHSCHDLVPLCVPCHDRYEAMANRLKRELAKELGAPLGGDGRFYDAEVARVRKAASALLRQARGDARIPAERLAELERIVGEHYGTGELTREQIEDAAALDPHVTPDGYRSHGEMVVDAVGENLQAFVERWRRHFIESLRPAHMPRHWKIEREVES